MDVVHEIFGDGFELDFIQFWEVRERVLCGDQGVAFVGFGGTRGCAQLIDEQFGGVEVVGVLGDGVAGYFFVAGCWFNVDGYFAFDTLNVVICFVILGAIVRR
jgi:hypothetical protein